MVLIPNLYDRSFTSCWKDLPISILLILCIGMSNYKTFWLVTGNSSKYVISDLLDTSKRAKAKTSLPIMLQLDGTVRLNCL